MQLALMASENRAAAALGRAYPGGMTAFVNAMNAKAHELEMEGLALHRADRAVERERVERRRPGEARPRREGLSADRRVLDHADRGLHDPRAARLVRQHEWPRTRSGNWEIGLSKTGFINAAGRCLVMHVKFATRSLIIVLLDSVGKYTRIGDANRIRQWLEPGFTPPVAAVKAPVRPKPAAVRTRPAANAASASSSSPLSSSRRRTGPGVIPRSPRIPGSTPTGWP